MPNFDKFPNLMEKIRSAAGFDITNPKECLAAVKEGGYNIQYIQNPDKEVQIVAVKQNGYSIRFIRNPDKEAQLAVIQQNPFNICYIRDPDKEVQMAAINKSEYDVEIILSCPDWEDLAEEIENNMIIKDIIE